MPVKMLTMKGTVKMLYRDCKESPSAILVLSIPVSNLKARTVVIAVMKHVLYVKTGQVYVVVRSACAFLLYSTFGRVRD